MRRSLTSAVSALVLAMVLPAVAAAPIQVAVQGPRISVGDLVPTAVDAVAAIDVGAAPGLGGSRVIDHKELERIITEHGETPPKSLPDLVRVVRKSAHLDGATLERLTRDAFAETGLPHGATLAAVPAPRGMDVPDGWTRATAEVPRPPRRTGPYATSATLSLLRDNEVLARVSVPVELALSVEAGAYDVPRGSPLTLVIRRGLIEINAAGTASTDVDVGGVVSVVIHPSGRAIPARLVDKDHAVALQ